jgi:Na+-transporting methylmalonyl-CoA/oxaloacetate decarboxylase gamma subunit
MVASLQSFVQQRYHALIMAIIGMGFVLLMLELLGYHHYEGLQIVGLSATVIGALASFLGIGASSRRRRTLAVVFLVLSLAGLLGVWQHNGERLSGERPEAELSEGRREAGEQDDEDIPPPPLAPLSLSGFCVLGAIALLGRKDL